MLAEAGCPEPMDETFLGHERAVDPRQQEALNAEKYHQASLSPKTQPIHDLREKNLKN
jgi:hypothetical protein